MEDYSLPEGKTLEDIGIEVKIGHPLDPHRGELRTEDEEKSVDAKGNPVVDGKPWSQVATGEYLLLAVSKGGLQLDRPIKGMSYDAIPGSDHWMTVGIVTGKPVPITPFAGAILEIPSDLGEDAKKQAYVAEWIAETAMESLQLTGSWEKTEGNEEGIKARTSSIGMWVGAAAEEAIRTIGL